ncbi:hypothetical protein INT47_006914, partial [Mucor saturninus]
MHESAMEEVRNRGEVFIIDATYKTNNLGMPLISIQSVSHLGGKSLMSTPIAYAFVANEKTETYIWLLKAFKQAISSYSRESLTPVFVTDKCSALMNAIEQVFPNSQTMLCIWHMNQNFNKELSHIFLKAEDKQKCIDLLREMIVSYTEEEFNTTCEKYEEIATDSSLLQDCSSYKAQEYLESNWLGCKNKRAGYITRMYTHFGCTTSHRVESTHRALKSGSMSTSVMNHNLTLRFNNISVQNLPGPSKTIHALNPRFQEITTFLTTRLDLLSAFNEVDHYVKNQIVKQNLARNREECYVDCMIRKNHQLTNLVGKVSARALLSIQKATVTARLMPEEKKLACYDNVCTCNDRICYALPCKHDIIKIGEKVLEPDDLNSRWLLKNSLRVKVNVDTEAFVVSDSQNDGDRQKIDFHQNSIKDELPVTESNALGDMLKKALEDHRKFVEEFRSMDGPIGLPKADHISKVGRPAKEKSFSPWRQISGAVSKAKQTKEDDVKHAGMGKDKIVKRDANVLYLPKRARPCMNRLKENNIIRTNLYIYTAEDVEQKAEERLPLPKKTKISATDGDFKVLVETYVDEDLPRNSFYEIVNVGEDGHCGFRALSYQVFGDEERYMEVKRLMRDVLLVNYEQYEICFDYFIKLDLCMKCTCSGLERVIGSERLVEHEEGEDKWLLAPECAQLAADTFQRPVAIYPSSLYKGHGQTFLPVFQNENVRPSPGPSPLPIVLQNVHGNHWITFNMKRSIKVAWPWISTLHHNAMERLGHQDDKVKSFWNKHLTFKKYFPSEQT